LILVAAGFDAHHDDPIGRCNLTEQAFSWLAGFLSTIRKEVKNPPVLFALEGGYQPRALADSVMSLVRSLTADNSWFDAPEPESEQALKIVDRVMERTGALGFWWNRNLTCSILCYETFIVGKPSGLFLKAERLSPERPWNQESIRG
jgi:hypothetical protein